MSGKDLAQLASPDVPRVDGAAPTSELWVLYAEYSSSFFNEPNSWRLGHLVKQTAQTFVVREQGGRERRKSIEQLKAVFADRDEALKLQDRARAIWNEAERGIEQSRAEMNRRIAKRAHRLSTLLASAERSDAAQAASQDPGMNQGQAQ